MKILVLLQCLSIFFLLKTPLIFAEVGYQEPWGFDSELVSQGQVDSPLPTKKSLLTKVAEQVILFHQNVLSPVDGPRSHFRPSSSNYMLLAMRRYGFLKGYFMGCDRLIRENKDPWVYRTTIDDEGLLFKWDDPHSK